MAVVTCKQCSAEVTRRTNVCPSCGTVLRQTLPPQTTGGGDVFALIIGLVVGLFALVLLTKLPGETGSPVLKTVLGVLGLMLPPALGLAWANRKKVAE